MAWQQAVDNALVVFIVRAQPILKPLSSLLKRYLLYCGFLIGLPLFLFLLLVSSSVFHWWRFPWSPQVTLWLFRVMTFCAVVDAMFYGAASLLFFLIWWRKKLRAPEQKRPRMALSYLFSPLLYGFIAAWGVTTLSGSMNSTFAYSVITVFMLLSLGTIVLGLLKGFANAA